MLQRSAQLLRTSLLFSSFLAAMPGAAALATEAKPAENAIDRNDFQAILNLATGYGEAQLTSTERGDPVITGDINGTAYQLFFLDCRKHRDCATLNFYATWDGAGIPLELFNSWNAMGAYNKAYLSEGGMPVVELNASAVDLTTNQLSDLFDRWTVTLAEFPREVLDKSAE